MIYWAIFLGIVSVAPWFFMLARLKNMGYRAKLSEFKRFFDDFGWVIGGLVIAFSLWGAIADVVFNWVVGTIWFRELPREFFFTQRVKRWSQRAEGSSRTIDPYRERLGLELKHRLNKIMPGHV